MDVNHSGLIDMKNIFDFIDEEECSIIYPFLERFFFLIERENPN
jgi:hypothetical protein